MKSRDLNNFLHPKSIAIIGASENLNKVGGILIQKLLQFNGTIIPINPNHEQIFGKKCYKSIKELKGKIDLVIIAIPAKYVLNVLKECGKKKIKNIIVISSGFAEKGNKKMEESLIKLTKKYSINLLGPNCFGIANPHLNLDTTFSNFSPLKGSTAFISQSGALASYIFDLKKTKLSGFVSLGNESDLNFSDWIEYFSKDKKTKRIVLYVEKINEGKKFIDVCKKCKKDIIVIKAGKTKTGSKATISHTGSLATDYLIYKGVFRQAEVNLVESIFNSIQKDLKKINGKKVLIITNAGGAGVLISDTLSEKNYKIVGEPIDILGDATSMDYARILKHVEKRKDFDFVFVILTPQKMSEPDKTALEIVKFSKHKKIIACFLGEKSIKNAKKIFKKNKINYIRKVERIKNILGTQFN